MGHTCMYHVTWSHKRVMRNSIVIAQGVTWINNSREKAYGKERQHWKER